MSMSWGELVSKDGNAMIDSIVSVLSARKGSVHSELRNSMSDFQCIEHRLEPVARVGGVDFINDSKATTVNATWWSIESQKSAVTWIVGGAKGGYNYEALYSVVVAKVKNIICFGGLSEQVMRDFSDTGKSIITVSDLKEAVLTSKNMTKKGDIVLFSPACSSFDMYDSYVERGMEFKKIVKGL